MSTSHPKYLASIVAPRHTPIHTNLKQCRFMNWLMVQIGIVYMFKNSWRSCASAWLSGHPFMLLGLQIPPSGNPWASPGPLESLLGLSVHSQHIPWPSWACPEHTWAHPGLPRALPGPAWLSWASRGDFLGSLGPPGLPDPFWVASDPLGRICAPWAGPGYGPCPRFQTILSN